MFINKIEAVLPLHVPTQKETLAAEIKLDAAEGSINLECVNQKVVEDLLDLLQRNNLQLTIHLDVEEIERPRKI